MTLHESNIVNILFHFFRGSYVFELWVEGEKLLGNLNLVTAISSLLHLVFCFDLEYPEVCYDTEFELNVQSLLQGGQTIADILQRKFADYGDDKGTRTTQKAKAAFKKLESYYYVLGQLA